MKRWVVLPGLAVLLVSWLIVNCTVAQSQTVLPIKRVPHLDATWMPGEQIPPGIYCQPAPSGMLYRYCYDANLRITAQNDYIVVTNIWMYDDNVTIGDLITQWGTPVQAQYVLPYYVFVYWRDRSAF